jgi:hypothetical protein
VVIIVAAGVTSAVIFSGTTTEPTPPTPSSGVMPAAHAGPATLLGEHPLGSVTLASTTTPLAAGTPSTIDMGNGVTLTPASEWTIYKQGQGFAQLQNSDQSAELIALVGQANASSITQESAEMIKAQIQTNGLTNVQQVPAGPPQQLKNSKNFQQMYVVGYNATLQNNQGTTQLYGTWVTLFNSSTHLGAFVDFNAADQKTFNASLHDVASMLASME